MVVYHVVETIYDKFIGVEVFDCPIAALDCHEFRVLQGQLLGHQNQKFTIVRSEVRSEFKPVPINTTMPQEKGG